MNATSAERRLALLEAALEGVPDRLAGVRELLADPAARARERALAAALTSKIHVLLTRLRHETLLATEAALDAADEADAAGDAAAARRLRRRAQALRVALDGYRETLREVLEQSRRDEAARVERHQRLVGYALAGLAAVAATPIVLGEMTSAEVVGELSSLPGPFGGLGRALGAAHAWLVLGAVLGAAALVVALGVMLARAAVPPRERGTDPVAVVGRTLFPLRKLAEEAVRDPSRRAEADRRACELLEDALARLREAERRAPDDPEEAVDAFVIRAELGARRPVPLPLPRAARLLHERLEPDAPGRWLSADELREIESAA